MGVFRHLGCVGGYPVMGGYTVNYVSSDSTGVSHGSPSPAMNADNSGKIRDQRLTQDANGAIGRYHCLEPQYFHPNNRS